MYRISHKNSQQNQNDEQIRQKFDLLIMAHYESIQCIMHTNMYIYKHDSVSIEA